MSASTWFTRQAVQFAMALVVAVLARSAFGQIQWTGATGTSAWTNPGNWEGGVVPGSADTARISSGFVTVNQPTQVGGLELVGGQFAGSSVLTIVGAASWTGGEILNGSTLSIAVGGTLTIQGSDTKYLYGSITNSGTINWIDGQIAFRGGSISNAPSGTMVCDSTTGTRSAVTAAGFAGSFMNQGTLRMIGPNGGRIARGFGAALALTASSTGSIIVEGGAWSFAGSATPYAEMHGTFQVAAGAQLISNGRFVAPLNLAGIGALVLSGEFSTDLTGDVALRIGGIVTAPVTISMTQPVVVGEFGGDYDRTFASAVTWSGGLFYGSGRSLVNPGVTMTLAPSGCGINCVLENDGVLLCQGGFGLSNGTLINRGTMTVTGNAIISRDSNPPSAIQSSGIININSPSFCRFRGGNTGDFLVNTGQLNYNSGELELWGGSTNAPLVVPPNGSLRVLGGFRFAPGQSILGGQPLYIEATELPAIPGSVVASSVEVRGVGCTISGGLVCDTLISNPTTSFRLDAPSACAGLAALGGNVTLNAPLSAGAIGSPGSPVWTINAPQQWPGFVIVHTISGTGGIEITSGILNWFGGGYGCAGDLIIAPAAAVVLDAVSVGLSGRLINRGSFEWRRSVVNMSNAAFRNEGQLTHVNSNYPADCVGVAGTNTFSNIGTLTILGGLVSFDQSTGGASAIPSFTNSGNVVIAGGTLVLASGSTSVPFQLAGELRVYDNFEFLCPSASAPTGRINFLGTVRNINFPLIANYVSVGGGTAVVFQNDQSVPEFTLGSSASIRGPGTLTVTRTLTLLNGAILDTGADLISAPGSTLSLGSCTIRRRLVNYGSAAVTDGTLTLDGADIVNNGVWSFTPSLATTTTNVRSAGAGGRFLNTGTLNKAGLGTTVFAGGATAVPLDNTGAVAVTAGTLTIGSLVNYDAAGNRLTGGMLSVTGPGVLNPTGVSVRTIGPGAGVTLAAAGATPAFLTDLTSNEGRLVIGAARIFNATPLGGTFTNAGELSLRAGGVFNAPGQFVQNSSGTLRSQIVGPAPGQIGRLAAAGIATLDGTMIAEFGGGYNGGCNQLFSFLTADSISGSFVDLVLPPNQSRVVRLLVGATTAAVRVTNPADVTSLGGLPGVDGLLTADDVVAYLNAFFAGNMALADIAALGGALTSDGQLSADDIVAFLAAFFSGCT